TGCRPAEPGEFTYRAFMNGKLDLVQAEGVLSLIESQSQRARRLSLRQLQGKTSHVFTQIEEKIVWLLSRLETNIDFSSEGIESISGHEMDASVSDLIDACERLEK